MVVSIVCCYFWKRRGAVAVQLDVTMCVSVAGTGRVRDFDLDLLIYKH